MSNSNSCSNQKKVKPNNPIHPPHHNDHNNNNNYNNNNNLLINMNKIIVIG